jgi:hypothetical protein
MTPAVAWVTVVLLPAVVQAQLSARPAGPKAQARRLSAAARVSAAARPAIASEGQASRAAASSRGRATELADLEDVIIGGASPEIISEDGAPWDGPPVEGLCGESDCGFPEIWTAGVELTFLKPRFEDNTAFTVTESDGVTFETLSDAQFDYDLELSPRVWLQYEHGDGLGLRAKYWQFQHSAGAASGSPPANGFGRLESPEFSGVSISSAIPTDTYTAMTSMNAYAIDLEGTKCTQFCSWSLGVGAGVRYASVDQDYHAVLVDGTGDARGSIDFQHKIGGIGPTVSLSASRPYGCQLTLFGVARGALLYGDGESSTVVGEDLDLEEAFFTRRTRSREDLLPVGEMQVGVEWAPARCGIWQPLVGMALEGQLWQNVGNASSEEGDLGFFGFSVNVGASF